MESFWENNDVQFPRLLAEIKAIGLTPEQMDGLSVSMDLTKDEIRELLDRAEESFEDIKSTLMYAHV